MRRGSYARILLAVMVAALLALSAAGAHAAEPVVHAVLFYSPTCGHCHKVITEDLPPLFAEYGNRLEIIGVNVADAAGSALFNVAGDKCNIPPESRGVPLLMVADVCLIGSLDIPDQLPGLIEQHLAAGGVDWPDIAGLAETIAQARVLPTPTPIIAGPRLPTPAGSIPMPVGAALLGPTIAPTNVPTRTPAATQPAPTPTPGIMMAGGTADGVRTRFARDPLGNGLAVVVLAGMVAALGWVVARQPWRAWSRRTPGGQAAVSSPADDRPASHRMSWAVPLLSLIGLGVAGYLAYVETQQVQAICGPVGDCNSVQQSEYARFFGLIPIDVLGVLGYLAILAAWAIQRFGRGRIAQWAGRALWAMAAGGVLFSVYLTFLEPFVIGATCAWCLTSAVIMTLLLLLTTAPVTNAGTCVGLDEAKVGRPAN